MLAIVQLNFRAVFCKQMVCHLTEICDSEFQTVMNYDTYSLLMLMPYFLLVVAYIHTSVLIFKTMKAEITYVSTLFI